MNEEQQKIAIAQACGWTKTAERESNGVAYPNTWANPNGKKQTIPDYLNDLNAMHRVEKVLRIPKGDASDETAANRMHDYAELLNYCVDATASQRAEAFLRVLNLWEDSPKEYPDL